MPPRRARGQAPCPHPFEKLPRARRGAGPCSRRGHVTGRWEGGRKGGTNGARLRALQRGDVTTVRTHVVPSWRTHGPREEKGSGRPLASPYGNYRGAGACRLLRFPAPAVPRGNLWRLLSAASTAKINTRRSHEVTGPGPASRSSAATRGAASGSPRGCPAVRAAGAGPPR